MDEYLKKLNLNQALYPPEDILKTKSVVLVSVPMDDSPTEWQEILDEMQGFFAEVGVDAVAYLNVNRFDVSQNIPENYPDFLLKRGIENLIFFVATSVEGPYFFAITQFNNQETFYNQGAPAFARLASKLPPVWDELRASFKTDQFQITNLLVNENPEFFYPKVEPGIVARSVPPQVAEFKIAMRPFDWAKYQNHPIYRTQYSNLFAGDSLRQALNNQNRALQSVSADSTNTLELVDLLANEAELRRAGFIYELQMVKGREDLVHEWIAFPNRPKPSNKMVYKFYLNDLRTNTIYIGKEWDASTNWFEAFNRFMGQIREAAATKGG